MSLCECSGAGVGGAPEGTVTLLEQVFFPLDQGKAGTNPVWESVYFISV